MKTTGRFLGTVAVLLGAGHAPVFADALPSEIPRIIVSAGSTWGAGTDSWAGYTGEVALWVPAAVNGGWTLRFRSPDLAWQTGADRFWNASAAYDAATQRFTLRSPTWSGKIGAGQAVTLGFDANGVLSTGFRIEDCTLNGQPCTAVVMARADALQTLANLKSPDPSETPAPPPPPSGTASLELLFAVDSAWAGGYGATLAVKNLGSEPLAAGAGGWQARLKFPDRATAQDVFRSGPWNFQAEFADDGMVTLRPMDWAGALQAGKITTSGFNGGVLGNLQRASSVDSFVTLLYAPSVGGPISGDPDSDDFISTHLHFLLAGEGFQPGFRQPAG